MISVRDYITALENLPITTLPDLLQARRPLILAPHPDDESLGAGGLIAAACAVGMPPTVIFLTDGAASHPGSQTHPPWRLATLREAEARIACALLGLPATQLHFLRYADTRLPAAGPPFEAALNRLATIAAARQSGLILAPFRHDPHGDHEAAAALAKALARRLKLPLLSYPVWFWLRDPAGHLAEPPPIGHRLDITQNLAAKQRAIAAHASQYGALIEDSPDAFRLPDDLLRIFARPYETFLAA